LITPLVSIEIVSILFRILPLYECSNGDHIIKLFSFNANLIRAFQLSNSSLYFMFNRFIKVSSIVLIDTFLNNNYNVRVLSRSAEKNRLPNDKVDYRIGDFFDTDFLNETLKGINIVVHLLSTSIPGTSNDDCVKDIETNLIGSVKLLESMKRNDCKKIIFISSGGTVYGNPIIVPTPEDTELRPICSYGITKVAIENYIYMFHKLYDLEYLIFRVSNLYGARQNNERQQGIINTLLNKISNNEEITIWGNGNIIRDYIYVEDFCNLIQKAITLKISGTFNAGSGIGISVNEIIKINCHHWF
jgi:UDP-glucose 4-epimerase